MSRGQSQKGGKSRGRRGGRNRGKKDNPVIRDTVRLTCAKCGEHIRHPEMALASPATGEPIHFDCAIEEVAEQEELDPREKICYLGQGNFGIIKYKSSSSDKDFEIVRKISYEKPEQETDWRKQMRDSALKPR